LEDLAATQAQQQEKIEQALRLHQFNADADELDEFIDQKYATLAECNASDLQDLPAKEHKLTAVRNDIAANQKRLKDLQKDSEELPAYAQVDSKLEEVVEHWDKLQAEVNRLHVVEQEAEQAAAFKRSCDEIESWIDNNEPKIMSTETGKDIEVFLDKLSNIIKFPIKLVKSVLSRRKSFWTRTRPWLTISLHKTIRSSPWKPRRRSSRTKITSRQRS
jgi:spectrin alpha